jgi:hypothetical protein
MPLMQPLSSQMAARPCQQFSRLQTRLQQLKCHGRPRCWPAHRWSRKAGGVQRRHPCTVVGNQVGIAWQCAVFTQLSQNLHVRFAAAEPELSLAVCLTLLRASHADMKVKPQNTRIFAKDGELGIRDGVTRCNADACKRPDHFFR